MVVPYLTRLRTLDQPGITPRRRSRFEPRVGLVDLEPPPAPDEPVGARADDGATAGPRPDPVTPPADRGSLPAVDVRPPPPNAPGPLVPLPPTATPSPGPSTAAAPEPDAVAHLGAHPETQPEKHPVGQPVRTPVPPAAEPGSVPPPAADPGPAGTLPGATIAVPPPAARDVRPPPTPVPAGEQVRGTPRAGAAPERSYRDPPPQPAVPVPAEHASLQRTVEALRRANPIYPQLPVGPDPAPRTDVGSGRAEASSGRVPTPLVPPPERAPGLEPTASPRPGPATVHVSIGRVEVTGATTPPAPAPRRAPAEPTSSLDAYLRARRSRQVG